MKISTFLLSVLGFCAFYVRYSDWVDEILDVFTEVYLGTNYEEVAPFIPSVSAGTEEFDSIVKEFSKTSKTQFGLYFIGAAVLCLTALAALARFFLSGNVLDFLKRGDSEQVGKLDKSDDFVAGLLPEKYRKLWKGEEMPLRVIWKGNSLMESSVHCNLKETKHNKEVRHPRIGTKRSDLGGGDDLREVTPSSSNESTIQRLVEIRKLLESESEIVDKCARTEDPSGSAATELQHKLEKNESVTEGKTKGNAPSQRIRGTDFPDEKDPDLSSDPKLMNRIRLLESRLKLEELKNKNWIIRMTRAEGILQQLNKQVERGIDSMSKGVNSSLPSGRAHRTIPSNGDDSYGNLKDHKHRNKLDAIDATEEESPIRLREELSSTVSAATV